MSTLTTNAFTGEAAWQCKPCHTGRHIEDLSATGLASLEGRKAAHERTLRHRIRARLTPTPQTPDSQPGTRKDTP